MKNSNRLENHVQWPAVTQLLLSYISENIAWWYPLFPAWIDALLPIREPQAFLQFLDGGDVASNAVYKQCLT